MCRSAGSRQQSKAGRGRKMPLQTSSIGWQRNSSDTEQIHNASDDILHCCYETTGPFRSPSVAQISRKTCLPYEILVQSPVLPASWYDFIQYRSCVCTANSWRLAMVDLVRPRDYDTRRLSSSRRANDCSEYLYCWSRSLTQPIQNQRRGTLPGTTYWLSQINWFHLIRFDENKSSLNDCITRLFIFDEQICM